MNSNLEHTFDKINRPILDDSALCRTCAKLYDLGSDELRCYETCRNNVGVRINDDLKQSSDGEKKKCYFYVSEESVCKSLNCNFYDLPDVFCREFNGCTKNHPYKRNLIREEVQSSIDTSGYSIQDSPPY